MDFNFLHLAQSCALPFCPALEHDFQISNFEVLSSLPPSSLSLSLSLSLPISHFSFPPTLA